MNEKDRKNESHIIIAADTCIQNNKDNYIQSIFFQGEWMRGRLPFAVVR